MKKHCYFTLIFFLAFLGAKAQPTIAAPTPPAIAPANVISLFSGAYTDVLGTDWFPNWGQTTIVTDVNIAGNATKKYENFNYQGVQFASPINATTKNYLHLDIWTTNCSSFSVFLVNQTTSIEQSVLLSPALSGWNSFDIPLSQYNTIALNNIGQLKFVGTTGSTVYLDNMYFFFIAGTPPVVSVTAPSNNAVFAAPANIAISANATDDVAVTKVEFYNGGTYLGVDSTSPYTYNWNNVLAGSYTIRAKATDNTGLSTTSSPINVVVSGPTGDGYCATAISGDYEYRAETANGIATFIMHPLTPIVGCAYALINIKEGSGGYAGYNMTAIGNDFVFTKAITNGTIATVYFTYQVPAGGERNSSLNPHTYTVGTTCTGIAGMPTVNITSPINNASFAELSTVVITANAASTISTVSKVDFYRGNTLLGTSTTSPYTYTWANAPAGNYNLVARVTDNTNLTTYASIVPIVVTINNSVGFCGTIANGDYSYRVETVGSTVVFTFHPLTPIAGCAYALIYVREGLTGTYPGYAMTKIGSDFRYTKSIVNGTPLSIYFTYQVPAGGENTSLATPHSYTVGTNCLGSLPVSLINFSATLKANKTVAVQWTTANEQNNDYYVVEKSMDGRAFKFIAKVLGNGNSVTTKNYSIIDSNPSSGLNYYRLTQVDKDGKIKILGTRTVNNKTNLNELTVYPNPIIGNDFTIQFQNYGTEQQDVKLFDVYGKLLFAKFLVQQGNTCSVHLPKKMVAGIYLLQIKGYKTFKLIVQE